MTPSAERERNLRHSGRSLLFALGNEYFRVELTRLREVLPWITLDTSDAGEASRTNGWLGWAMLRGERLPVVDLNELVRGEPTPRVLGSRILVLECKSRVTTKRIGVVAGQVFAMALDENATFAEPFDPCDVLQSMLARIA